jgi:hypothetical protein
LRGDARLHELEVAALALEGEHPEPDRPTARELERVPRRGPDVPDTIAGVGAALIVGGLAAWSVPAAAIAAGGGLLALACLLARADPHSAHMQHPRRGYGVAIPEDYAADHPPPGHTPRQVPSWGGS